MVQSMEDFISFHGENFLRQFEDAEMGPSTTQKPSRKKTLRKTPTSEPVPSGHTTVDAEGGPSSSKYSPNGVALKMTPADEIAEIIQFKPVKSATLPAAHSSAQTFAAARIDYKAERRAFMSHKASKVHSQPSSTSSAGAGAAGKLENEELDPLLSPEEFKKLQLEVERLGGGALDKKQRKQWKAQLLQRLGAKAEKTPRCPAKIGLGMAKKKAERSARAMAEAIAAGLVRVKGSGKKKQAEKEKLRDRGLMEAGRNFKNGILKVKNTIEKSNSTRK